METPMMKCGHAANATCSQSHGVKYDPPVPSCAICSCIEVADEAPNLEGRMAHCAYFKTCNTEKPSALNLAFFEHKPEEEHDRYYCGCHGWD